MSERSENLKHRQAVRDQYQACLDEVSAILFEADPIDINYETNTDEYEPEVRTILPRLSSCNSSSDVQRVIHEEFLKWFGAETAGAKSDYSEVAERVWRVWQRRRKL